MGKHVALSDEIVKHLDKIREKFNCSYSDAIKKLLLASGYVWSEENILKVEIWRVFAVMKRYMPSDEKVLDSLRDLLTSYVLVPASKKWKAEKLIVGVSDRVIKELEGLRVGETDKAGTDEGDKPSD